MKPFILLIAGVVVGWAASGVDWSREAVGQDALIDAPPSTLQQDVPDAPPQPTFRAVPANSTKANAIFQEGSNPRQRSALYDQITGGQPYSSPPTDVVERRVTDDNGRTMAILENRIHQHSTPGSLVGRFQASAYGSPNGHGCYIVDTMTGKLWHVANGQLQPHVVTEGLQTPVPTPAYDQPAGVIVPTPSNSEPSIRQSAPLKFAVEPTPLQGPEPTDAE